MELGAFSISLSVKDIAASRAYYETFGFREKAGNMAQNWIVLQNGTTNIGLFQGMFEGNILTFNPGWDQNAQNLDSFTDIRDIQKHLKSHGIALSTEVAQGTTGPASLTTVDPDGNAVLIDQHR